LESFFLFNAGFLYFFCFIVAFFQLSWKRLLHCATILTIVELLAQLRLVDVLSTSFAEMFEISCPDRCQSAALAFMICFNAIAAALLDPVVVAAVMSRVVHQLEMRINEVNIKQLLLALSLGITTGTVARAILNAEASARRSNGVQEFGTSAPRHSWLNPTRPYGLAFAAFMIILCVGLVWFEILEAAGV
jgi:uncharacterized membrane-anchored protein YitT (DUF2179 family)